MLNKSNKLEKHDKGEYIAQKLIKIKEIQGDSGIKNFSFIVVTHLGILYNIVRGWPIVFVLW